MVLKYALEKVNRRQFGRMRCGGGGRLESNRRAELELSFVNILFVQLNNIIYRSKTKEICTNKGLHACILIFFLL